MLSFADFLSLVEGMQKHSNWEVTIQHGPAGHDNKKIKVRAPDAETAQSKAETHFKKKYPEYPRGSAEDYRKLDEGIHDPARHRTGAD